MMSYLNIGEACSRFLDAYKATSPGTVAHLEENLERALFGRAPQRLDLPVELAEIRSAPTRMPWEKAPSGVAGRESLADYGISWVRPADWQPVKRGYGIAVYNAGFPETAQVIVTYKAETIDDVLPYINLWREREDLATIDDVASQPMESLEAGGRRGLLVSFSGSTQVLLHDGPHSWIVTMYGDKRVVAARLGELRDFVRSFEWHGAPNPPVEQDDRSKSGGTRSLRRRAAPAEASRPTETVEPPERSPQPNEATVPSLQSPPPPPARPASEVVLPADAEDRCARVSASLLSALLRSATSVAPLGRADDGCRLDVRWGPPMGPVVGHFRSALAAAGLTVDEDRAMPALGGRHLGRHFFRFSGPEGEGSVLIDEFKSPPEVLAELQLDAP